MTRQAAAWSEHDLDHRFALGPPHDELTELAATLDGLLDRIAASLRHERRFSAELSHELRTPLARVLARVRARAPPPRATRSEYEQALELIHGNAEPARAHRRRARRGRALRGRRRARHRRRARRSPSGRAARLQRARRRAARSTSTSRSRRDRLRVGVDADLAERILQPVVENACRYGSSRVRIEIDRDDSSVVYAIEDDGPGVADDERERIFEPGVRGTRRERTATAGAGLGLAARAQARTQRRRRRRRRDGGAGGRFVVRLPGMP